MNGPRVNKTDRRARTRTVRGVTLRQTAPGQWVTPDDEFIITFDEHCRAWWINRADLSDVWYGSLDQVMPQVEQHTLTGSVDRAVRKLQWLGWLDRASFTDSQLGHCAMRDEWLPFCGPFRVPVGVN